MARSRHLRLWAMVMLAAVCLGGVGADYAGQSPTPRVADAPLVAISALEPGAAPAVLPVPASDELRAATQLVKLRALFIMAVLAGTLGLLEARWRRSIGPGWGRRPLCACHHTICLRAPPLLQFA